MVFRGARGLPAATLVFSAMLWGMLWWPLKRFGSEGLAGPLLSLYAYGGLGILGIPILLHYRTTVAANWGVLVLMGLLGGWSNASFVTAIMTGDVVRVMLLFYLAPAWAVLGGWLFLGERLGVRRLLAVILALGGAAMIIDVGSALKGHASLADGLALSAGIAFAGDNLCVRAASAVTIPAKLAATFLGCGVVAGLLIAGAGTPLPPVAPALAMELVSFSLLWLLLGAATTTYGVTHLEAGQSGIIILLELVVAVFSATLLGAAHLTPREALGGLLVVAAALLEVLSPGDPPAPAPAT